MKKLAIFFLCMMVGFTTLPTVSASALPTSIVSVETTQPSISVNDQVSAIIMATSANELYGVELKVLYDADVLQLIETTSTTYHLFQSELTSPGSLYISGIAKSNLSRNGNVELLKVNFKAKAATQLSEISVQVIKGVTNWPTTNVVNGISYPDVVVHPVSSGSHATLSIEPSGSNSNASPESGATNNVCLSPIEGKPQSWETSMDQALSAVSEFSSCLEDANLSQGSTLTSNQIEILETNMSQIANNLLHTVVSNNEYELTKKQLQQTSDLLHELQLVASKLGLSEGIISKDLTYAVAFPTIRLSFGLETLAGYLSEEKPLSIADKTIPLTTIGNATYSPHQAIQINVGDAGQHKKFTASWSIPADTNADLVGVYKLNEESGEWDYIRGSLRDNDSISVDLSGSGTFALMTFTREYADLGNTYTEAVKAIERMTALHIVSGINDTSFAPAEDLTRAEWATMLVQVLGAQIDGETPSHNDLPQDAWYYDAMQISSSIGLLTGFPDGSIRPNDSISRAELAMILSRLAKMQGKTSSTAEVFTDDEQLPSWAKSAVYEARANGWINGNQNNEFNPQSPTTRADAMVILNRLLNSGI